MKQRKQKQKQKQKKSDKENVTHKNTSNRIIFIIFLLAPAQNWLHLTFKTVDTQHAF